MPYPSTVTSFTNPLPTDKLNSPSHSSIETAQNTGLMEIQTFVGTLSSAVGTLVYDVRGANSNGGGHVQTANKGGTGQTSFTKGDLLVATSSSVLAKLAIGAANKALVVDATAAAGMSWGNPLVTAPTVRIYDSSVVSIWNKPSNLSFLVVELVGGGGGGASSANPSRATGAGGGGGGYTRKVIPASAVGAAVSVRAGGGGLGSILAIGAGGGLSYFGSLLSALGGSGGGSAGASGEIYPGAGGSASILGDYQIPGMTGEFGYESSIVGYFYSGGGGNSFLGPGAPGIVQGAGASDGNSATTYGGGGGGAIALQGSVKGGTGGTGVVIVHEY